MALILNLETAADVCSVALGGDGQLLVLKESHQLHSHSQLLTSLIENCMRDAGRSLKDLDAIAVSKGPGSFTGLRIGAATAKGLCYALDKPLIAVNTLLSMASVLRELASPPDNTLFCPMLDARRMEVYSAIFTPQLDFFRETTAEILDQESFSVELSKQKICFFGDGMKKFKSLNISNKENALFDDHEVMSASGMVTFSEKSYHLGVLENVAYFEPYYLKDFFSGSQSVKGSAISEKSTKN